MTIAPDILTHYPDINNEQKSIIGHIDGAMLIIAGPGSGKTHSIVLRALNLLLLEKTTAKDIVLCTFTEKAALQMRERLSAAARKVNYTGDLSEIRISTIHGLCNKILQEYRHYTKLSKNYNTLDELTQLLFIFENFKEIIGDKDEDNEESKFLGKWQTRWTAIKGVQGYFDKIAEELVPAEELTTDSNQFIRDIGNAYLRYQQKLTAENRIDFSHLQTLAYTLLQNKEVADTVKSSIRYLLVDEYQDTNYIQQQLIIKLSENTKNLCVVGDEDQSIYRFRGATVRNILEFPQHFPGCKTINLTTNYRSHRTIIEKYDNWMASADWDNPNGNPFRHDKQIIPDPKATHPDYPAVVSIWGGNASDEGKRFADFVQYLKDNDIISDYSQVALLLHSVQEKHSSHYISALSNRGIPAFCPRARNFFNIDEIRYLVACYTLLFNWTGSNRGDTKGAVQNLADYVDECLQALAQKCGRDSPLAKTLRQWITEIEALKEGEMLNKRSADYFYRLLALEPFRSALKNETISRNLSIFSKLLGDFQEYYHYSVITHKNREIIKFSFFTSFLRLLYDGGINEFEDGDNPFPKGYVQIMTIHQAKGLEFPVVAVGSLTNQIASQKEIDRNLLPFYKRDAFEPENRITNFDRMRLHYVAFSRAQKILLLTAHGTPKNYFAPIWDGLPQLPHVETEILKSQHYDYHERAPIKKSYSFTTDLTVYDTCPRQYQFFRDYDFTPSRLGAMFFGLLVHETIEEIHRTVLAGKLATLNQERIKEIFANTFRLLVKRGIRPVDQQRADQALEQVMNYFEQNQDNMQRVVETEIEISLEKEGYILTGTADLLLGDDKKLELLDFKTAQRPQHDSPLLDIYRRQLCTYAHILQERRGKKIDRLLIYWTSEKRRENALMIIPYQPEQVTEAGKQFDKTVNLIQSKEFAVKSPPEYKICNECDLSSLCRNEGIIKKGALQ